MGAAAAKEKAAGCTPSGWSPFLDVFVGFAATGVVVESPTSSPQSPLTVLPAAKRLVALGDVHGDLEKTKAALRLAGLIGKDSTAWTGGDAVLVQVGDTLDRGDNEVAINYLLDRLRTDARTAGGDVHVLNGNHEIMNVEGDFRFATAGGCQEFEQWLRWHSYGEALKRRCPGYQPTASTSGALPKSIQPEQEARFRAVRAGGPFSRRFFADRPTVLQVGSTLFAHGGVLPDHVAYGLDKVNKETHEWLLGGKGHYGPRFLHGSSAVVWSRHFSERRKERCKCDTLKESLAAVPNARRLVFRVDVGMSAGCGNFQPEIMEILNDQHVRVLTPNGVRVLLGEPEPDTALQRGMAAVQSFLDALKEVMTSN
eukprot:jgi/Chlat1/1354/Chrsp119S00076